MQRTAPTDGNAADSPFTGVPLDVAKMAAARFAHGGRPSNLQIDGFLVRDPLAAYRKNQ